MRWIVLLALVACHHSPAGPPSAKTAAQAKCFQDGAHPPWHWPHDPHELIDGLNSADQSSPSCPLDEPQDSATCTGEIHCYYVSFDHPCDPTSVSCQDGVFTSGRVMF